MFGKAIIGVILAVILFANSGHCGQNCEGIVDQDSGAITMRCEDDPSFVEKAWTSSKEAAEASWDWSKRVSSQAWTSSKEAAEASWDWSKRVSSQAWAWTKSFWD